MAKKKGKKNQKQVDSSASTSQKPAPKDPLPIAESSALALEAEQPDPQSEFSQPTSLPTQASAVDLPKEDPQHMPIDQETLAVENGIPHNQAEHATPPDQTESKNQSTISQPPAESETLASGEHSKTGRQEESISTLKDREPPPRPEAAVAIGGSAPQEQEPVALGPSDSQVLPETEPVSSTEDTTGNTTEQPIAEPEHVVPGAGELNAITSEQIHAEPITSEQIDSEPTASKQIELEPITSELIESEPTTPALIESEPEQPEQIDPAPAEVEQIEPAPAELEHADPAPRKPEPIEPIEHIDHQEPNYADSERQEHADHAELARLVQPEPDKGAQQADSEQNDTKLEPLEQKRRETVELVHEKPNTIQPGPTDPSSVKPTTAESDSRKPILAERGSVEPEAVSAKLTEPVRLQAAHSAIEATERRNSTSTSPGTDQTVSESEPIQKSISGIVASGPEPVASRTLPDRSGDHSTSPQAVTKQVATIGESTETPHSNIPDEPEAPKPALQATTNSKEAEVHIRAQPSKDTSARSSTRSRSPPKSEASKGNPDDTRPPWAAPTPPVRRARPRHIPAFEDDEDDDDNDAAIAHPRLRSELLPRDPSRGLTYPPQSSQSRSLFASRVPSEHYTNPPHPPPPGYHPRYYPPTAPPYYHSHNPSMSQSGGYSNHSPYGPPSHSSSPYQESWNQFPPGYPSYGSPPGQRHDSVGSREYALGPPGLDNGSAIEDDTGDLFSRIAQAIPDLHVLLTRYKETHGQLGAREELLRRAGAEQQERLKSKDDEINHLKERIGSIENKHSNEASRLRFEIANMEEQLKELRELGAEIDRYKKEAEETRIALEAAKMTWETKYKELETAHSELERLSAEEKIKAKEEFDEWKATTTTKHDAEKIALAIQFDKKLKEADVIAENLRQEANAAFIKDKDELRSEHQRQQRERESSFDRVRKELETKLTTAQKDREEALKHERESREVWEVERENLSKAHQEDRDSLQKSWDDQRELTEAKYKKMKDESDKAWIELHAEANKKAEEEKAKAEALSKRLEDLQKKYDDLKAESGKEKEIIRSVAGNLESEKARLEKLMECYGDIAEIKSKGDTYYLVSFSQLQKQILDLAATHFKHLPVTPPSDVLENIPLELPSFLGNTDAARQLRAAYVAHTVSAMVTFRVFGPFLFSLGRRYDKADSLFLSMSNHIRDKSTRKEAIWRQQTLLAAFTSSGAKQRINTAAGTVVDEIVTAVKHFADPREEEGIKIAVRRIVKLAAETWRFARLEREMITATMPAVHDEQHEFTNPEFWTAYRPEDTPIASLAGTAVVDERPKLLLRLFPVIYREPQHEKFRSSQNEVDEGCVYHHGLALYEDAKAVELRREEIKQAGLPPVTTASPTAADFPEPIIPPPRHPPPPPPPPGSDDIPVVRSRDSSRASPGVSPSKTSHRRHSSSSPRSDTVLDDVPVSTNLDNAMPASVSASPEASMSEPPISEAPKKDVPLSEAPATETSISVHVEPQPSSSEIEGSRSRKLEESERSLTDPNVPKAHYVRPIPGPIEFSRLGDTSAPSARSESVMARSKASSGKSGPRSSRSSSIQPLPSPSASKHGDIPSVPLCEEGSKQTPLLTPKESVIIPPSLPPLMTSDPSSQGVSARELHSTASDPPRQTEQQHPLTPPGSRPNTPPPHSPPSPLFAADDEIEALQSHRSRTRATSTARRTASSRNSNEELKTEKPDTVRRTSGYSISSKQSNDDKSLRSERSERSSNSRYTCESRSAAIKALYPNSPLAGTPPGPSRTNSIRSQRNKPIVSGGTWDTSTISQDTQESQRDSIANSKTKPSD